MRNRGINQVSSDVYGLTFDELTLVHFLIDNATAADNDIIAAATATSATEVTTFEILTNPDVPRNLTATVATETANDVKAVAVTVVGTNYNDEVITETLPAFTDNTPGTVVGVKAFKTVTSASVPAMDGASPTVSIGVGTKFGLPFKLDSKLQITNVAFNGAITSNAPTIVVDDDELEKNTIAPHGSDSLNGAKDYEMYIIV